ncbi:hypothetical protein AHF37_10228 [Paragonimus kellicotti]|nr:hypothetical protein AHF37_10228 [Paragonimus kellicotti]
MQSWLASVTLLSVPFLSCKLAYTFPQTSVLYHLSWSWEIKSVILC